jgi:hypothetical protein
LDSGKWYFNDYTYMAYTAIVVTPAQMTSPANGSTFTSDTVTFVWDDVGADLYYLYVGTSAGANDLYAGNQLTNTSKQISNLPTNGSTIYVRLWSLDSGKWYFNDYTYTAYTAIVVTPAQMTSPANGSTFTSDTVTFVWDDVGADLYYLYVGTSAGANDLYVGNQLTNTSKQISSLPTNGSTIYVRLWSFVSGTWYYNDYTYTAS